MIRTTFVKKVLGANKCK